MNKDIAESCTQLGMKSKMGRNLLQLNKLINVSSLKKTTLVSRKLLPKCLECCHKKLYNLQKVFEKNNNLKQEANWKLI